MHRDGRIGWLKQRNPRTKDIGLPDRELLARAQILKPPTLGGINLGRESKNRQRIVHELAVPVIDRVKVETAFHVRIIAIGHSDLETVPAKVRVNPKRDARKCPVGWIWKYARDGPVQSCAGVRDKRGAASPCTWDTDSVSVTRDVERHAFSHREAKTGASGWHVETSVSRPI